MNKSDLIIRSRRVVTSEMVRPASIHIHEGVIIALGEWDEVPPSQVPLVDAGDAVIMPGLVDTHVHVNEPGRTEWEGFATATRAGAAGGVTTLVDMPLNSIPPTTTEAGLAIKLAAASGKCWIDVAFWGGVIPGNTSELVPLYNAGVCGFKCFLVHSGVDEFPNVNDADLREAMPELARLGAVLLVHAEMPGPIEDVAAKPNGRDPHHYQTFLNSRPRAAENEAVELMVRLCREMGTRVHIVHHSSADAVAFLRKAKDEGLPFTVETCPHYLTFTAEEIPDRATHYKCCPPVREKENREQLWAALADGTIDMIVSDHSPCTPDLKLMEKGDFIAAWGGIAGLQFSLPAVWTQARLRGFGLHNLTKWMSEAPAQLAGLDKRKGKLLPGFDADIVIWHPEKSCKISSETIHQRHKLTPYADVDLQGFVEATYVRGVKVYENGKFADNATGNLLTE